MQQMVLGAQRSDWFMPLWEIKAWYLSKYCTHTGTACEKPFTDPKPQQTLGWPKFPSARYPQGQTKYWMKATELQACLPVGQISKGWNTSTKLSTHCLEGESRLWLPTSINFSSCAALIFCFAVDRASLGVLEEESFWVLPQASLPHHIILALAKTNKSTKTIIHPSPLSITHPSTFYQ